MAASEPSGVRYFMIPVVTAGGPESGGNGKPGTAPAYVATALPAAVAAPAQANEPQLGYDTSIPVPEGPLTDTVTQFLSAYLTGTGNLSRYLAPGTTISAISPAPYTSVQNEGIYTPDGQTPAQSAGATIQVLAQIQASASPGQQWPLTYTLTMTAVSGQWDVSAIDLAPALASR